MGTGMGTRNNARTTRANLTGRTPNEAHPWENGSMGPDDEGLPADVSPTGEEPLEEETEEDAPEGFDRWRKESAIGGIGTGIARGLQSVFAPPPDEVVIVAAVPGEPPDADTRLRVILDPDDPTKSIAVMPATPSDPPPE
jgi:hypothetical protein